MKIEIGTGNYFNVATIKPSGEVLGTLLEGETAVTTPNVTTTITLPACDSVTFDEDGIYCQSVSEDGEISEETVGWADVDGEFQSAFSENFE